MRGFWTAASLLWLAGVGLRLTVLAVPPVITLVQSDLDLSGTEVGILSGLPVILFGMAALPGSLLIARFGALPTLVAGLLVAGVASGLRGAVLDVAALYAATILMSAGIAIMQPALPTLVRMWMPHRVSLGTALCTNGLLVGETLPVMLTIPLVFLLVDGSWRLSFVFWGLLLILIAIIAIVMAPRAKAPAVGDPAIRHKWWPDWRNKLIWQMGILLGSVNGVYFCTNAFLPGYLAGVGRPDLVSAALTALNFGQLPASFALLVLSGRLERRSLAVHRLRRPDAGLPRRHCHDRECLDDLLCGDTGVRRRCGPHPRFRAACTAECTLGCRARVGGDVHDQLQRRIVDLGVERCRMGSGRQSALRVLADRDQCAAAAVCAGCHRLSSARHRRNGMIAASRRTRARVAIGSESTRLARAARAGTACSGSESPPGRSARDDPRPC